MQPSLPSTHGDKLKALLLNDKLPIQDLPRVEEAIHHYKQWREDLHEVTGNYCEIITQLVSLLNTYTDYIEINLIFDSPTNFLYRQKGQLKISSTIMEEFLPILVSTALANLIRDYNLSFGPTTCFSGIRFESNITNPKSGGGMRLREKNHDFAISRKLYLQTSYRPDFSIKISEETHLAYIVAECKTNLDKTMFQEAAATALDVKTAVPGAQYYLLCEWLDMTPINTRTTAIDEIIILRKAKRLTSNIRKYFSSVGERQENRDRFTEHLNSHPFSPKTFIRFVDHIKEMLVDTSEDGVLTRGYF